MASSKYNHGNVSKADADALLAGKPDGAFLVRDRKPPSEYILSMAYKGKGTAHLLQLKDDLWTLNGKTYDVNAKSLDELIDGMKVKRPGWPCTLTEFVTPAKTEDGGANQDAGDYDSSAMDISKQDADKILNDSGGGDGTYLFRRYQDNPLTYILSVIFKGKPTHHLVSREKPDEDFMINKNVLAGARTLNQVAEQLKEKKSFWPVPLIKRVGSQEKQKEPEPEPEPAPAKSKEEPKPEKKEETKPEPTPKKQEEPAPEPAKETPAPSAEPPSKDGTAYHGFIDKNKAEEFLTGKPDGTFLIRLRNDNDKEEYIISVVFKSKPTHHLIERQSDKIYKLNGVSVEVTTLQEVIEKHRQKHKRWPVPLKDHIPGLPTLPDEGEETAPEPEPEKQEVVKPAEPQAAPEPEKESSEEPPAPTPAPASAPAPTQNEEKPKEEPRASEPEPVAQASAKRDPEGSSYASGDMDTPITVKVKAVKSQFDASGDHDEFDVELPYPDLDLEERTVEPEMTEFYHGDISSDDAEILLQGQTRPENGMFLFTQREYEEHSLQLFALFDGQVKKFDLTRGDYHEPFFIDKKATGATTLVDLVEFLSDTQPGWNTLLTQGIKGIKVLPLVEKLRMKTENDVAIAQAKEKARAAKIQRLKEEAKQKGELRKSKAKEEYDSHKKVEQEFMIERERIKEEFAKLKREEIKKKKIEQRKRDILEQKKKELYEKYHRDPDDDMLVEVDFDSSDSESSDDDEEEKQQLRAWRRRASAKQFGFQPQGIAEPGEASFAEEDENEFEVNDAAMNNTKTASTKDAPIAEEEDESRRETAKSSKKQEDTNSRRKSSSKNNSSSNDDNADDDDAPPKKKGCTIL